MISGSVWAARVWCDQGLAGESPSEPEWGGLLALGGSCPVPQGRVCPPLSPLCKVLSEGMVERWWRAFISPRSVHQALDLSALSCSEEWGSENDQDTVLPVRNL